MVATSGGGGASLSGIDVFTSSAFPINGSVGEIVPIQVITESAVELTVTPGDAYRFDIDFSFGMFGFESSDPLGAVALFASYYVVEGSHTMAEAFADSPGAGGPGTYTFARDAPLFFVVNAYHTSAASQIYSVPSGSDAFAYTPVGSTLTVISGLVAVYEDGSFGTGSGANPANVSPYISGLYWKV